MARRYAPQNNEAELMDSKDFALDITRHRRFHYEHRVRVSNLRSPNKSALRYDTEICSASLVCSSVAETKSLRFTVNRTQGPKGIVYARLKNVGNAAQHVSG